MGSTRVFRNCIGYTDWNVGGLFAHDGFLFRLYDSCKANNLPFPIKYVFGSIPCRFQGGRVTPRTSTMENVQIILNKYSDMGVGCRFTFSNSELTESDLDDGISNKLLSYLNNSVTVGNVRHGVIVSSDILARYIRENYKNLELISSQVKPSVEVGLGSDNVEYYNELFDLYDIVVVNPAKIRDYDFLNSIKHKDRVEFIVNHRCRRNCGMAKKHYMLQMGYERASLENNEEAQKHFRKELEDLISDCSKARVKNPFDNTLVCMDDIDMLVSMGFKHFKLEGRDNLGLTFIRDIGQWIFNPDGIYLSLVQSFQDSPV